MQVRDSKLHNAEEKTLSRSWPLWILSGFIIYQVILWAAWVIPSRHYVGFDEGWHLEVSQYIYHGLTEYGILGLFYKFIHAMQAKPPLVSLLPVPMYLLFGNHAMAATAVNLVWLMLLNVFLFRLVRHFWEDGPALISCISLQTMPLFPGLSRLVMAEYGTTALVVIFIYYLLAQEPSMRRAISLGVVAGLGVFLKVLFVTYIIGPLAWVIFLEIKKHGQVSKYRLLELWFLTLGIAAVLAAPWYFVNLKPLWQYTFRSTYSDFANVYRFGTSLNDFQAVWLYLCDLVNSGITAYQAILLGTCWIGYLIFCRKTKERSISSAAVGIGLWFVVPFLTYLPSLYRNFKFMMPFFAPFSIALGITMWRLVKGSRWRWIILAGLLVWPNFAILYASFPLGGMNRPYHSFRVGPLEFLPQRAYMGFPKKGRWPYREILEYVSSDGACIQLNQGKLPTL
jgi:4-amino-4-deoxy-L-arabinose transferase-like glycosyltransferase